MLARKPVPPPRDEQQRVLAFLQSHCSPWRFKTLAAKLRIEAALLSEALAQLEREGRVVSCVVSAPGRSAQREYRIAAKALAFDLHKYAIGRKSLSERTRQAPGARSRAARKRSRASESGAGR